MHEPDNRPAPPRTAAAGAAHAEAVAANAAAAAVVDDEAEANEAADHADADAAEAATTMAAYDDAARVDAGADSEAADADALAAADADADADVAEADADDADAEDSDADELASESSLSVAEAEQVLAGAELVPAISGSIPEMKALRARCLAAGIPALLGCPPGAGQGGKSCGTRTHLLVEEDELPRLAELFRDSWRSDLAREGLSPVAVTVDEEAEHPPCPACGTAAALVEGACSDCGLQLE